MSNTTFKPIGEYETPPDFDPAFVAARPTLRALLDKAPPTAHRALVYMYARGEAQAQAEAKTKVHLGMPELRALATQGDEVAAGILAVRKESLLMGQWANPTLRRMARAVGITKEDWRKYAPVE